MKRMRLITAKLARDEAGQALIGALLLLLMGSLIVAPLVSYTSSAVVTGQVQEDRSKELYAADAGAENAIHKIQNSAAGLPEAGGDPLNYGLSDMNGKSVGVSIEYVDEATYKITSTATSADGSSVITEAYVTLGDAYSYLLNNAITSTGDITIKNGSEVTGDIQYNGILDNEGNINGGISTEEITSWPTAEEFSAFYLAGVSGLSPYPSDAIDLKDTSTIGPLYREGDLTIDNTGSVTTATNEGIIYITGNLTFAQAGVVGAYTIDLNGQTIYVEGNITISPLSSLAGSGCLIAAGDISFQPNILSDENDFIFVMSIDGEVYFSPQADFYGAIAGATDVQLQPDCTVGWREPSDGLDFPGGSGSSSELTIHTWQITNQ